MHGLANRWARHKMPCEREHSVPPDAECLGSISHIHRVAHSGPCHANEGTEYLDVLITWLAPLKRTRRYAGGLRQVGLASTTCSFRFVLFIITKGYQADNLKE